MLTVIFVVLLSLYHTSDASKFALMRSHAHQVHVPTSMQVEPDGAVAQKLRPALFQTSVIDVATAGESSQACGNRTAMLLNPPESSRSYSSSWQAEYRFDASMLNISDKTDRQWWPSMFLREEWLQIDLGSVSEVAGVVLQGNEYWQSWITSFKVRYRGQNTSWIEMPKVFAGASDPGIEAETRFDKVVAARFLRIVPVTWKNLITARAGVLVCGATCRDIKRVNPPETARSYSSVFTGKGFQYASSMMDSDYQWCSDKQALGEWMQIDMGSSKTVVGALTQGAAVDPAWVTEYQVRYSVDGLKWTRLPDTFPGNADQVSKVQSLFPTAFQARYVRIFPTSWYSAWADVKKKTKGWPEMRAALLVCDDSPVPWQLAFSSAMKMAKDWALSASGAWSVANAAKVKQWLGVNFISGNSRVGNVLRNLPNVLDRARFLMPESRSLCSRGVLAYTIPDSSLIMGEGMTNPVVYLCQAFFDEKLSTQQRAGVLLHEALHCSGTSDTSYHRTECAQLPDGVKSTNTNNYVFFLLDVVSRNLDITMPEGTLPKVNCSELNGTVCDDTAGVCKMNLWLVGQSCADYCRVNNLYCKGAANATACSRNSVPDISMCQQRVQDWGDVGTNDIPESTPTTCWCTPIERNTYDMRTTSTTTSTRSTTSTTKASATTRRR